MSIVLPRENCNFFRGKTLCLRKEERTSLFFVCLFVLFIGLITDLLLLSLNLIGENVNCVFSLLLTIEGGACDPN